MMSNRSPGLVSLPQWNRIWEGWLAMKAVVSAVSQSQRVGERMVSSRSSPRWWLWKLSPKSPKTFDRMGARPMLLWESLQFRGRFDTQLPICSHYDDRQPDPGLTTHKGLAPRVSQVTKLGVNRVVGQLETRSSVLCAWCPSHSRSNYAFSPFFSFAHHK